ncbi:MAG: hypothetical protein IPH23_02940 [Gammaproteobacteria bacterium]|nr:hypothetical protein [Gammaproteobacteria bacterium]
MEQLAVQDAQLDDILRRLARADDAMAVLDEQPVSTELPGGGEIIEKLAPEIRAAALYRHLREIRATGAGPRVRLERATYLTPLITETVNALMTQPVTASDRRLAISMPIALLKCSYDIKRQAVLQSVCQPRMETSLVTDSILATFSALFDLLVCYWVQRLPPPQRFWGELHALYHLASHVGVGSRKSGPRQAPLLRDIRNAYLKPLLLGSLGPTRFNVGEIKQLVSFVANHAALARLGTATGLFSVDPWCDRPPTYAVRNTTKERSVTLCTHDLVQILDNAETNLTPRLREDLRRYWSSEQVRSEYHQRTDDRVEIVFGLEAAHRLLTGCVDDDDFLGHLGARDAGQRVIAQTPIELHSATCVDRSPSGAKLQMAGAPDTLRPGELVTLLMTGEPQCRLGIVRWTQLTPKLDSVAGVQWLPDSCRPCGTAVVAGTRAVTPYFRSFLIPTAPSQGPWELIAPTRILKPGDHLHLITHEGEMNLSVTTVVDMTFHVSRFHTAA